MLYLLPSVGETYQASPFDSTCKSILPFNLLDKLSAKTGLAANKIPAPKISRKINKNDTFFIDLNLIIKN
ncbi:hypothetical protein A3D45_01445 [Candidatus Falkowbacteria bacterium RIFCSPHIGHO2_02_FULL_42_9]|uniref:Uncharacterized protein n=1 Tax=Candidatus Falkowbacteria bacterium RIFCSPHIGHO2_02_FULL_42_9 TaxID=1797986 RepID=A0A1F5S9P5_9BACT|nr:MAG: hypothetical protein A3D45_01445 [Candidatus Falkowbacteria bacterium RIFCSPHIGHO2_02_FULL_42_9]